MKIAIVHDYLVADGGAEKCLRVIMDIFPGAPLFVLFYHKDKFKDFKKYDVRVSFLDKIPFLKSRHYMFLPLYAMATESLNLKGYDMILSSSWAWSKGVRGDTKTCHICYCYTPMRFAHYRHMREVRLADKSVFFKWAIEAVVERLRKWDLDTINRVDYFIATCMNVKKRIKSAYNRESAVIHPPLDIDKFIIDDSKAASDYYLIVSRLVPYKMVNIVIAAFNRSKLPLKIVGTGVEYNRLKKMSNPNIEFLGNVNQKDLLRLYQGCKALISPQEEDWGIAALEAQACGRPVIAYAKGGALEYVIEGKTGHFFDEQTPDAIIRAVKESADIKFDPGIIRQNVLKYDSAVFKDRIKKFIEEKYAEFRKAIKREDNRN